MVARVGTGKRNGWHEIVTFLKAQASSLLATAVDFGVTVLLANLFGIYYVYATFIGALSGGCVNCAVNYKWNRSLIKHFTRFCIFLISAMTPLDRG